MKFKNIRVLFVVLGAVVFHLIWGRNSNKYRSDDFSCEFPQRVHVSQLRYVDHAKCRMDCREVSRALVERVYKKGEVNCRKSGTESGSPRWALEYGDPQNEDTIRLIVEEEDPGKHVIITVIRLDRQFNCDC